jgi:hypothetical protein
VIQGKRTIIFIKKNDCISEPNTICIKDVDANNNNNNYKSIQFIYLSARQQPDKDNNNNNNIVYVLHVSDRGGKPQAADHETLPDLISYA